jgi:hypothetical protein
VLLLEDDQLHEDHRRHFTISPTAFLEVPLSRAIQRRDVFNRPVHNPLGILRPLRARLNQQRTAFLRNHRGIAVGCGHICIFCTNVGLRVK